MTGLATATPNPKMMIADNLSEPENYGFCLDLTGWGESTKFTNVQLHSCKPDGTRSDGGVWGSEQQFFPENDQIVGYTDAAGRCLQAKSAAAGSGFDAGVCNTACGLQSFCFNSDGTITLNNGNSDLCIVAGTDMSKSSTTCSTCNNYQSRSLLLADCASTANAYKQWKAYNAAGTEITAGSGCTGAAVTDYTETVCPVVEGASWLLMRHFFALSALSVASLFSFF